MSQHSEITLDTIAALAKRRGFVFPTSTIYGGIANSYDYGPLGVELLRNIKNLWWREFITKRPDMVGLDSQIILHPQTWVASGHVGAFNDPLVEDTITHKRYRADHLIEAWADHIYRNLINYTGPIRDDIDYQNFFQHTIIPGQQLIPELLIERIFKEHQREYLNLLITIKGNSDIEKSLNDESIAIIDYLIKETRLHYQKMNGEPTSYLLPKIKRLIKRINDKEAKEIEKKLLIVAQYYYFWGTAIPNLSISEMTEVINSLEIKSPDGNPLTEAKAFNLLFETAIGAVSGEKSKVYLRGETAQGIFTDFKHVLDSTRVKLPFGVGQIGKSFRNEVTTGQFVFRTFEFEQAEIEYFFDPEDPVHPWETLLEDWKSAMWKFVTETLGIRADRLRWRQHTDKERSHYSKDTYDLEYLFPFGWKELWGIAYRTNYDLTQHMQLSGESLEVVDSSTGRKFIPHVIEPAVGVNRLFLMALMDAYFEDTEKERIVLSLKPQLAPYQVAVFPLLKNKPELVEKARTVFNSLLDAGLRVVWDDRGNIGKRYLSQDEIGTPWCITVDFQTLEDNTVTIRHRDTAEQERVALDQLPILLRKK